MAQILQVLLAALAIASVSAEGRAGCCFAIGYGSLMKPCCLTTKEVLDEAACASERRIGGATTFHAGACPATAEEADALLKGKKEEDAVKTGESAKLALVSAKPVQLESSGASPQLEKGCCFSVGYGDRMKPCCLTTEVTLDEAKCTSKQRLGGFTAFHAGSCPVTAEDAMVLLKKNRTDIESPTRYSEPQPKGCCFSIGYGALMKPCCLKATLVADLSQCGAGGHIGGLTSYREGACPTTAEEAALLVKKEDAPMQHAAAKVDAHQEPGCCYSIGYGTLMKPCCLTTKMVSDLSACASGKRLGGATAFHAGSCPATPEEANLLMHGKTTQALAGRSPAHESASATRFSVLATVSIFLAGGAFLGGAFVMWWRRRCSCGLDTPFLKLEEPSSHAEARVIAIE